MQTRTNQGTKITILFFVFVLLFSSGIGCQHQLKPPESRLSPEKKDVLKVFTDVYVHIQRDYIAPVSFPDLIENTLKGLQNLLEKERLSYVKTDHRFVISCSGEEITVEDAADEYRKLRGFADIFSLVERKNPQFELLAIVYAATKGIARVDSHSAFLPRDEFLEMQADARSRFTAIGVEIRIEDDVLTVVSPIEDAPASKAGIQARDQIIAIDGTSTKGLALMEGVKRLRGPKGTQVTITVMREGFSSPKDFTIIRDVIPVRSLRHELLEEHYGYIKISQFQEKTDTEFDEALKALESQGTLKGLVLDLRNNQGGLLDRCVKLADRFIESGLIISLFGKREDQAMKFNAHQQGTLPNYPLVVLTNNRTAAGAEIVLGALQDQKRAIIVGSKTLGQGTVQTIYPLRDGSGLRLTTGKWLTPDGHEIEGKGILPDLFVISEKDKSLTSVPSGRPMIVADSNERDAVLRIALQILKKTPSSSFEDLMRAAKTIDGMEMKPRETDIPGKK